jgi:hypothetical protein
MDTKAISELAKEAGMTMFGKRNGVLAQAGIDNTTFIRMQQGGGTRVETATRIAVILADSLGKSRSDILGRITGIENVKKAT